MHAYSMEVEDYIKKNSDNPVALRDVLIDMAKWEHPDLRAAEKILKLGVSANATDKGNIVYDNPGWTAITTAASYGKTSYVKLLLNYGANVDIKDPWDGRTALMAAALYGYSDTVKLLLENKANVNAANCFGTTALMWAAEHGHVEVVKQLLDAGADVRMRDEKGNGVLDAIKNSPFDQYAKEYTEIKELIAQALQK